MKFRLPKQSAAGFRAVAGITKCGGLNRVCVAQVAAAADAVSFASYEKKARLVSSLDVLAHV